MDQGRASKFWYYKHHTPAPEMRYFVPFFLRPGTYKADKQLHKKITWPMKFGSPDWSLVPMPAKRMLKMEVQKVRTGIRGCYSWLNASDKGWLLHCICTKFCHPFLTGLLGMWLSRHKKQSDFLSENAVLQKQSPSKKPLLLRNLLWKFPSRKWENQGTVFPM